MSRRHITLQCVTPIPSSLAIFDLRVNQDRKEKNISRNSDDDSIRF